MPEPGTGTSRALRFARMAGTSSAAPDAAPRVSDFLNAAYRARPRGARSVEDPRPAFAVLTTGWWSLGGRRPHPTDLPGFHRAFGRSRLRARASRV